MEGISDKEYISKINKSISELSKLKDSWYNKTIDDDTYIWEYNNFIKNLNISRGRRQKIEEMAPMKFPDNFDFWFKYYYDNKVSQEALSHLYNKHRLNIQSIINKYIKLNNLKNKLEHLKEDLGYQNPRLLDIPIGVDKDWLNKCHLEPFNIQEVYKTGVAKSQDQLEYLIHNYHIDNLMSVGTGRSIKRITIEFGDEFNPAIIDFYKFKFRPSDIINFIFIVKKSTIVSFRSCNWTQYIIPIKELSNYKDYDYIDKRVCFAIDDESSIVAVTDKYTDIYKLNKETNNIDEDILLKKILFHIDNDEKLITLKELEEEIFKIEGVSLDIQLKNDNRPKDQIYVHHYPYDKGLPSTASLDDIMYRLKRMGLDL